MTFFDHPLSLADPVVVKLNDTGTANRQMDLIRDYKIVKHAAKQTRYLSVCVKNVGVTQGYL